MTLVRTLVVDDDHEVAGVHTGFLLAHGAFDVVGVAYSGAQSLEMIRELKPDLVLLDVHLPDMSGIDVLRTLRTFPGDPVDVIAITAARELETVRAAMAGGVLHYLIKPFNSKVLLRRLDDYMQHRASILEHTAGESVPLDQERIDRLLAPASSNAASPNLATRLPAQASLPKGLSAPTLRAVEADLRASSAGASASEVAGRLGLARVSARRYLEFLVERGSVQITPRYGAAGRPEKFYLWTAG